MSAFSDSVSGSRRTSLVSGAALSPILGALVLGLAAISAPAMAAVQVITASPIVEKALTDATRPAKAKELDASRRPVETLTFAGVAPGDKVADLMPGAGYYTLLFADIVGPKGKVYAVVPKEILKFGPRATDGITALQADHKNIALVSPGINEIEVPEKLDLVWTSWNYHDLHDPFMGPADVAKTNAAIFNALKPGGAYIIVDHRGAPGSGLRDTNTLHRIDIESVKAEVQAAGFVLESASNALANPSDPLTANVFDGSIRGKTDSFVLKFRKPR
jgi:predicted methyltransferase